jgi:capsular exopolysaccharide synthesis family protein
MSRIHDALKKAEREKAAGVHGPVDAPVFLPHEPPVPGDRTGAASRAPDNGGRFHSQSALAADDMLRLGDLLANCSAPGWTLNPAMCVFAEGVASSTLNAEQFRTLRARLREIQSNRPLRTVLVTSAVPGEGKTFISGNLAQALAQQGDERVLLIDTDLRRPRQHVLLGAPSSPGLADFLRGNPENPLSIIQRGRIENLFLIPGGVPAGDASELVAGARLRELLGQLTPLFHWIILDSPPVLSVSDAAVLSGLCDGVIFVVKAGSTALEVSRRGCDEFQGKNLLGVVLNSAAEDASYGQYYYAYQIAEDSVPVKS